MRAPNFWHLPAALTENDRYRFAFAYFIVFPRLLPQEVHRSFGTSVRIMVCLPYFLASSHRSSQPMWLHFWQLPASRYHSAKFAKVTLSCSDCRKGAADPALWSAVSERERWSRCFLGRHPVPAVEMNQDFARPLSDCRLERRTAHGVVRAPRYRLQKLAAGFRWVTPDLDAICVLLRCRRPQERLRADQIDAAAMLH